MSNFRKVAGVQLIIISHMGFFSQHSMAGQYDNQVLAEVSAKEFIMILDQPVPKLFKRTQLPNAQNNLCTVNNGQASSVAIASKLRVVGGAGASTTLPVSGSNTTANTANTTQNNKPSSSVRTNTTTANSSTGSTTTTGVAPNRTQSGEVQTSATTYVPSLPTPRTSTSANTNTASNSNVVVPRTTTAPVVANNLNSNTSNSATVNTSNNQVRPTQQVATNTTTTQNRPATANTANTTTQNSSTTTTNADVPYVGNAIATVNLAVNFGNDSDRLSTQDRALLKELASALNSVELKNSDFAIVGHTNSTGPLLRNLELSCARAIAVRNYLIDLRVNANRLTPYGFGPDKPLANVAAQDAVNRRVEISRAK